MKLATKIQVTTGLNTDNRQAQVCSIKLSNATRWYCSTTN